MKKRITTQYLNCRGLTLIEITIVLVIVGILISLMSTVMPSVLRSAKIKKTAALLQRNDKALEQYIVANGRCPCPDTDSDGLENRNNSGTPDDPGDDTCSAYVGSVPYRTLGFSSGADTWGNPLRYSVYDGFIRTTTSGLCTSLAAIISATSPCNAAKLHTTSGGICTNQAYVIVSSGPNGTFDGMNSGSDTEFEEPDKTIDATYDDSVIARIFVDLYGKYCTSTAGMLTGNAGGIKG